MTDFSRQQRYALRRLLSRQPLAIADEPVATFLLAYMFIEALLQTIGRYYRERAGTKPKVGAAHDKLQLDVVQRSLKYFGIAIAADRLGLLLDSGAKKRGAKSHRNLRNGIVHEWSQGDLSEVTERFKRLHALHSFVVQAVAKQVVERGG